MDSVKNVEGDKEQEGNKVAFSREITGSQLLLLCFD